MGLRACVVVCVTSFLLGSLFTHWIADSLTLWKQPLLEENLLAAASYYSILSHCPSALYYVYSTAVLVGGATILWSLRDGEAGNLMFDGGSIFLFATTVTIYLYSVLPSLINNFHPLPPHALTLSTLTPALREETLELASSHLICSVALTGVLILQAGRHWADKEDAADKAEAAAASASSHVKTD